MRRVIVVLVVACVVIYLVMIAINSGRYVHVGPNSPTPTPLPTMEKGCRQIEYRAARVLGVKDQVTIEEYRYDSQVLWCWSDGKITESHLVRQLGEAGGIPGWAFVQNLTDSSSDTDAIGRSSWTETSEGEFAFCVPLSVSAGQQASVGVTGSFCPLRQTARIDVRIDGRGNYSANCGDLTCDLVNAGNS